MQLSYFSDMFVEALQSVCLDSYDLLVTGDFNAHNSSWCPTDSTSKAGDLLSTVFAALGLHQMVDFPTHSPRLMALFHVWTW